MALRAVAGAAPIGGDQAGHPAQGNLLEAAAAGAACLRSHATGTGAAGAIVSVAAAAASAGRSRVGWRAAPDRRQVLPDWRQLRRSAIGGERNGDGASRACRWTA